VTCAIDFLKNSLLSMPSGVVVQQNDLSAFSFSKWFFVFNFVGQIIQLTITLDNNCFTWLEKHKQHTIHISLNKFFWHGSILQFNGWSRSIYECIRLSIFQKTLLMLSGNEMHVLRQLAMLFSKSSAARSTAPREFFCFI